MHSRSEVVRLRHGVDSYDVALHAGPQGLQLRSFSEVHGWASYAPSEHGLQEEHTRSDVVVHPCDMKLLSTHSEPQSEHWRLRDSEQAAVMNCEGPHSSAHGAHTRSVSAEHTVLSY